MKNQDFLDKTFSENEQLPRKFIVNFQEVQTEEKMMVKVILNGTNQVGDLISDNSYSNDYYRYHDVFHYSFATLLGWSPCARAMMQRKRKSNIIIDEIEDGARAAITEEALSMIIFNEAKRKAFFKNEKRVSKTTLRTIKEMTDNFEVKIRTSKEWENAILKSYQIFRLLIENRGGTVNFDSINKDIVYSLS